MYFCNNFAAGFPATMNDVIITLFRMSALLQRKYRDGLMDNYLAFDLLLIIEMLVLMIKKTGTACIAMPAQTNVFIIFYFKVSDCY